MKSPLSGRGTEPSESKDLPIYPLRPGEVPTFLAAADEMTVRFLRDRRFEGASQSLLLVPGVDGLAGAVLGLGDDQSPAAFGDLARKLPAHVRWSLQAGDYDLESAWLGIVMGAYSFDRFKSERAKRAIVTVVPPPERAQIIADAICFARDLINTPASHLGPADLAQAGATMAARYGGSVHRVRGAELEADYPALAAVGAGSDRSPEMLQISWGDNPSRPLVSLCGKGVCFDTGGYDLKPSSAMLRMKKDMGGAAIALGLAQAIMALNLDVRLEVRLGCAENSVSGHAMRPLDVLRTRAGVSVEVGNTDAEGRLVLADLLTDAAAAKPDWLIDFATLTGAARVALGPDVPALFSNDDKLANTLTKSGAATHDPLWRLPLWDDYAPWLDSTIADTNTMSSKPFAGAIVAALFLRRFVPQEIPWAHIDTYAWNDSSRPARPEGGEAQALRATLGAVEELIRGPGGAGADS